MALILSQVRVVTPLNTVEHGAVEIGGFDGGPIEHGRAPRKHGWDIIALQELPVIL